MLFVWVGDDESGPEDARMIGILSANDGSDDAFRLDLKVKLTSKSSPSFCHPLYTRRERLALRDLIPKLPESAYILGTSNF